MSPRAMRAAPAPPQLATVTPGLRSLERRDSAILVAANAQQHSERNRRQPVPALLSTSQRRLGIDERLPPREQQAEDQRATGVATFVSAPRGLLRHPNSSPRAQHPGQRTRTARAPQLVGPAILHLGAPTITSTKQTIPLPKRGR